MEGVIRERMKGVEGLGIGEKDLEWLVTLETWRFNVVYADWLIFLLNKIGE